MRNITHSSQQVFPARAERQPAAVLELLDTIKQAEADRDYWRTKLQQAAQGVAGAEARLERLQIDLARARAEQVRKRRGKGRA